MQETVLPVNSEFTTVAALFCNRHSAAPPEQAALFVTTALLFTKATPSMTTSLEDEPVIAVPLQSRIVIGP